jgi:hypothetical protein
MSEVEELRLRGGGGSSSGGGGGIGGSGVFGVFGTVVQCKSDDNSWYCMLSKFVNVLIMLVLVFYIFSIAFDYLKGFTRKKFKGGSGSNNILKIFGLQ